MAKLVGVYHDEEEVAVESCPAVGVAGVSEAGAQTSGGNGGSGGSGGSGGVGRGRRRIKSDCLARRQLPLTIEHGLTMIMALDDACLACGNDDGSGAAGGASDLRNSGSLSPVGSSAGGSRSPQPGAKKKKKSANSASASRTTDVDGFLRKYDSLDKDDLSAAFVVSFEEFLVTLSNEVPCVGCRRSVESLLQKLFDTCDSALEPLIITDDATISVARNHIVAPHALANLFCVQTARLEAAYEAGFPSSKSRKGGKVGRCAAHSLGLGTRKLLTLGHWLDTWECMERECQEEVVLIHFDLLRATLDRYLKKHSFCLECTNMVNKAYNLLVCEDDDEAVAPDEGSGCSALLDEAGDCCPSPTLPRNIYRGITACINDQHVHVECTPSFVSKLITMAEPELSGLRQERHAKTIEIAQKEVLTCIGICLYERFQRIQQRLREGQQSCDLLFLTALKSLRRSFEMAFERKQGMTDLEKFCLELDEEERRKEEKAQRKRDKRSRKKKAASASDPARKDLHPAEAASKNLPTPQPLPEKCSKRTRLPSRELPSLQSMLEKAAGSDEENFIPLEDIQEFRARMPEFNRQREELRKNLRQRFNQLCINGL